MGHNLGMRHDFDPEHGGDNGRCVGDDHIMSYGNSKQIWTECNTDDFQEHYDEITIKQESEFCAKNIPRGVDNSIVKQACEGERNGNGMETEDEETAEELGIGGQLAWLLLGLLFLG